MVTADLTSTDDRDHKGPGIRRRIHRSDTCSTVANILNLPLYTANVYRDLRVVYSEINVQGFQIYGDCMSATIPVILKSPNSDFHCNICR